MDDRSHSSWFNRNPKKTYLIFFLIVLLLVELFLRIAIGVLHLDRWLHTIQSGQLALDAYEMEDPDYPGHWILRPNYGSTYRQEIDAKKQRGADLGVAQLIHQASSQNNGLNASLIRINRHGFKGPDIDESHSSVRIVCIGDSCTFGSGKDYPRELESALCDRGREVEVVNAGVEGYYPSNVLKAIDRLKALEPEITTIYLGWNAFWGEERCLRGWSDSIYTVRLVRRSVRATKYWLNPIQAAKRELYKPKHPDPKAAEIGRLRRYVPSFMGEIETIVTEMESVGSRVVLLTLPGLYVSWEDPSPKALEIGHLPSYTDNPYVFAMMTERYNQTLRELADRRGLLLIDLEQWGKEALLPRDSIFFDSVHLNPHGVKRIGLHIAEGLDEMGLLERLKPKADKTIPR